MCTVDYVASALEILLGMDIAGLLQVRLEIQVLTRTEWEYSE